MSISKSDKLYRNISGHTLNNTTEVNLFPLMFDSATNEYFFNIFRNYIVNKKVVGNIVYYLTHEVGESDWLDTIAYKYYQIPGLWWIVALMNDFNNPFEDLEPGTNLKILRPAYLYQMLREITYVQSL